MNSTNAHAAAGLSLLLNTTRSLPPTKDVELCFSGSVATAHFPSLSSPPVSRMSCMCHGPDMNIG